MKTQKLNQQKYLAMTLIECLLAVFVVLVFAAVLLPLFSNVHHSYPAKIEMAETEIAGLTTAIEAYESDYGHLPVPDSATNEDVTYGINAADIQSFKHLTGTKLVVTNSDLIIVLMDFNLGVNADYKLNPKRIQYLNARMAAGTNSPGVSAVDHQYRDPWGNLYIISLDANQNGFVRDAFYANSTLYADHKSTSLTNQNSFYELNGKAMVWSRGPDGQVSLIDQADTGVNKDNVVSWQ